MTILEAMACGCPVVAVNVGGISGTVFDSVTGRLYQSGDIDSAAEAVWHFLDDSPSRERIARASSDFVSIAHSSSRTAELYIALFDEFKSSRQ